MLFNKKNVWAYKITIQLKIRGAIQIVQFSPWNIKSGDNFHISFQQFLPQRQLIQALTSVSSYTYQRGSLSSTGFQASKRKVT